MSESMEKVLDAFVAARIAKGVPAAKAQAERTMLIWNLVARM